MSYYDEKDALRQAINSPFPPKMLAALQQSHRFPMTYCSQCGKELGPGDSGVSNCYAHNPELKAPLGPFRFLEDGRTEDEANAGRPLTICDAENNDVAQVFSEDDSTVFITRTKASETARLFAASPQLLQALKKICNSFPTDFEAAEIHWPPHVLEEMTTAYEQGRAAIAKATGAA